MPNVISAPDINEAVRKAAELLTNEGQEYTSGESSSNANKKILELTNCVISIANPRKRIFHTEIKDYYFNPGLAAARLLYLISGSNKLKPMSFYTHMAKQHSTDNETLNGFAYGYHIFDTSKCQSGFAQSLQLIKTRPYTKKAYISLNRADTFHNAHVLTRSCALEMVFLPRSCLNTVVVMRANDAIKLLPYNFFEFSIVAECMAAAAGYELGTYEHFVVSLHARDIGIKFASQLQNEPFPEIPSMTPITAFTEEVRLKVCQLEEAIRIDGIALELLLIRSSILEPLWQDLLVVAFLEAKRIQNNNLDTLANLANNLTNKYSQFILLNSYRHFLARMIEVAPKEDHAHFPSKALLLTSNQPGQTSQYYDSSKPSGHRSEQLR